MATRICRPLALGIMYTVQCCYKHYVSGTWSILVLELRIIRASAMKKWNKYLITSKTQQQYIIIGILLWQHILCCLCCVVILCYVILYYIILYYIILYYIILYYIILYYTLHPNQQNFKLYKQTIFYILNCFRVHLVSNMGIPQHIIQDPRAHNIGSHST